MVVPLGCLGFTAIYYNLAIGLVNALLFIRLFTIPVKKGAYLKPWKILFIAGLVFFVEEILVFMRAMNLADVPLYVDGYFGLIIVALFLYMLLLQKEYMEKTENPRTKK